YFPGDAVKLRVADVPLQNGLRAETATTHISVRSGNPLKVVLVWTDPAGPSLVNDLDLWVTDPAGSVFFGNGQADHVNNVEAVSIARPLSGVYTISVSAARLGSGARQGYALVITGDITETASRARAARH
ncbi:MAG TPA: hypothetical protein VGA10_05270, partial [Thermoanaerobaculia bacterium]